jgi:hypothetical protein
MRLARIVGAFVALILTATMGTALVSPAEAAGKPKHDVVASGSEPTPNHFIIKGKVTTFHGKVKLLRKVGSGSFKVQKKVKVKRTGKFRTPIFQVGSQRTCFKIQVPAQNGYKKTTTPNLGCIVRT